MKGIVILSIVCTLQVGSIWSLPHAPVIANNSDAAIIIPENTTIGTVIRTIIAEDEDGDDVIIRLPDYDSESKTLVEIRQLQTGPTVSTAELVLRQKLDRDYNPGSRVMHFVLEDTSNNRFETTAVIELIIKDIHDEVPVFKNLPYRLDLREDEVEGSVVYTNILATDPDNGIGGLVSYYMEPITQSIKDAELFRSTFEIDDITGHVKMVKSLDYETIQIFQFRITAKDGVGWNSTEVLTIRVLDMQDTPPEFQGLPYVVTVTENIPLGTHFYTVRAMDGDRGVPNDVVFKFEEGPCYSLFEMNSATGEVTVNGTVDRDDAEIMKNGGICVMKVLVIEMYQNFPQLGSTQSETTLSIYVTDENDNRPAFNQEVYSAYIQDTALLNYPLQLENKTEIVIEDLDQGSSGILELMLRSQDGEITYDFEPIPSVIASLGRPIIALKSPRLLNLREQITLTMYAMERDTVEAYTATATIVIRVLREMTTTPSSTAVPTTTPRYKDPFIPSILGFILPFLLLVWAAVFTGYYCVTHRRSNRVGHSDQPKQDRPRDVENGSLHTDRSEHHVSEQNGHATTPRNNSTQKVHSNNVINVRPLKTTALPPISSSMA